MSFEQKIPSLFSRNMGDVRLNTLSEPKVDIRITYRSQEFNMTLTSVKQYVTLRASEIAHGLMEDYEPYFDSNSFESEALPTLSLYANFDASFMTDAYLHCYLIKGGYNQHRITDEADFLMHHFLTWRPQITNTSHGVKEQLTVVNYYDQNQNGIYRAICAKLYFKTRVPSNIVLGILPPGAFLWRIDCSLDTIIEMAAKAGIYDEIVAYDIWGSGSIQYPKTDDTINWDVLTYSNTPYAQRFIVIPPDSNRTYFFFQNTLGGFDTIAATGIVKSSAEGDVLTAINNRTEKEVTNNYVKSWEVNTGYIATDQEENWWHEFFRSTNRYVLLPDGTHRKIIVDEYKAERTSSQLGSFTFKFHYSTADNGSYFERTELDEFENNNII